MGIYESLGLRPIINADARLTRLGGSIMPEPVLRAMQEAARSYVDIFALQRAVGKRLAELTRNEAAYVTTGASAGLFLTTLACMVGVDLKKIARLPDLSQVKHEVIIHRAHRIPYDPAVQLTGAKLVEIGNGFQTFPWEFEAAVTDKTAAVVYIAGEHLSKGVLSLPQTIELAHAHGIPVIVDAAAQLPPAENLWRYTRDLGADLAIFSGGKDLRGPQASGLIVGRADLIEGCYLNGAPHQRFGRPMKVGREEMIGLLTAVQLYVEQDHRARIEALEATVRGWIEALDGIPGVRASRSFPNEAGQPTPRLLVEIDHSAGLTAQQLRQRLWEGDPAIAVPTAGERGIYVTPDTLEPGDARVVAQRLRRILLDATRGRGL